MSDRKISINELEITINGMEQFRKDLKPYCGNSFDWKRFDAGLAMLKAQVPVKAIKMQQKKYIGRTGISYDGSCGSCGTYLMRSWIACPICGKKVYWQ